DHETPVENHSRVCGACDHVLHRAVKPAEYCATRPRTNAPLATATRVQDRSRGVQLIAITRAKQSRRDACHNYPGGAHQPGEPKAHYPGRVSWFADSCRKRRGGCCLEAGKTEGL